MLHSISWKQFLECIAWAAGIYYLIVGVRYYRQDIMALLTAKGAKKDVAGTGDRAAGDPGTSDSTDKTKNI